MGASCNLSSHTSVYNPSSPIPGPLGRPLCRLAKSERWGSWPQDQAGAWAHSSGRLQWREPRGPRGAELQSGPGRHVRARPPPAHCRSYPKVVGSVFHWLHAVPLVPGVGLAQAAQQLLIVEAEEAELAAVRAAEARGAVARPARALGLLAQQLLHQVVEGVVGAQVGEGRAVLAHRAGGRHLHLPAAGHAPAAEVVAAAQSHGVPEGVVADGTEQLLLEGTGRPWGRGGTQLHRPGRRIPNMQLSLPPLPPA